jgi:ankyrin repeat protein
MIKPPELASDAPFGSWSCRGCDVWDAICAAVAGDAEALRRLLERDPNLYRAGYWYTQPIHFAVREGHLEAVRVLLEAGADPAAVELSGESLIAIARDRGHEAVARVLEEARARQERTAPDLAGADHAIHLAAAVGDVAQVEKLLDADPQLLHRGDGQGGTPLHRAVGAAAREVIELLLDRGADIHARHGAGGPNAAGYAPVDFLPIDLALWGRRPDRETARLLLSRGADGDTVIAAALGDRERVTALLAQDPARIEEARPCGRRALSAAVEFGHEGIARMLMARGGRLDAGATISARDDDYRSTPLAWAARNDLPEMVELLLARGAPTNLPDDEPWATPLAWATKRGHGRIAEMLRRAGATA